MTLEEAQAQMPAGYRLVYRELVTIPPATCDAYFIYRGEQVEHCVATAKRAVEWVQEHAKRKAERDD
jgi:hypothetical protein